MEAQTLDSSKPEATPPTVCAAPTSVEDLERRLKALREMGVMAYKDGPIEIVFAPAVASPLSAAEVQANRFAELEARAQAEGGTL